MIPQTDDYNDLITDDFEYAYLTDRTYELDPVTYRVKSDKIEGVDSVRQEIYLILSVERYDYVIYDEFGVELKNLYAKQEAYVIPELERVIKDAVLRIDRVESISNFTISKNGNARIVSFIAHSIYGDIDIEKEVNV